MKVIKKLILNRNNMEYYYTEKIDDVDGFQYVIYNAENITAYTPESFYTIFGTDEKMPLIKFINNAEKDLVEAGVYDNGAPIVVKKLDEIKQKIAGKNLANPSLWGYKDTLLTSINIYNRILSERENEIEFDYEQEHDNLINLLNREEESYTRINKQDVA